MSKRFGRQQKRKARAEIARLQAEVYEVKRFAGQATDSAKAIIKTLAKMSPNSAFLKKATINTNTYTAHRIEQMGVGIRDYEANPDKLIDLRLIDLYDLELAIKESGIDQAIHFDLRLSKPYGCIGHACYRVSKETVQHLPVEVIANELVGMLKVQSSDKQYWSD